MPEPKSKVPEWAFADGSPKPEYSLPLRTPLSDGTKSLMLSEPNIKTLRRATKLLVFSETNKEDPVPDSAIAFGVAMISGVTNLPEDIIEELPRGSFKTAVEYLQSFS